MLIYTVLLSFLMPSLPLDRIIGPCEADIAILRGERTLMQCIDGEGLTQYASR